MSYIEKKWREWAMKVCGVASGMNGLLMGGRKLAGLCRSVLFRNPLSNGAPETPLTKNSLLRN